MKRLLQILWLFLGISLLAVCLVPPVVFCDTRPDFRNADSAADSHQDAKSVAAEAAATDWFCRQRAFPNDSVPCAKYTEALKQARQMRQDRKASRFAEVTWNPAGPTNIPGRICDIAVHDSDSNTIYAASAAGGIFKSTDRGTSWTAVFDEVGAFAVGAVAIDPTTPQTVYAGTGEPNAAVDNYSGTGIYKSTDGGVTWHHIGLESTGAIGRIVVDPIYPQRVYVAATGRFFGGNSNPERGVYRSEDGGASWTKILYIDDHTGCVDLALHPASGTLFAAMWRRYEGPTSALWRSTNRGDTWEMLSGSGGLPATGNLGRIGVTVDPFSETVYALHISGDNRDLLGMFKSTDLGATWTRTNDANLSLTFGGYGWYLGQVRVAPGHPDIVYSLGVTLWKSSSGGNNWYEVTHGTHEDHHAMYISGNDPSVVYGGCDGGVNYSDNGGASWTTFRNMPNTQFHSVALDYQHSERLYGGAQGNGTNRTLTGALDDWHRIVGGDGFDCNVDYADPDVVYAEAQYGNLFKSVDGGHVFVWCQDGINTDGTDIRGWNTPVVMDPHHPNVLYFGTNRVYQTVDAADNWKAISPQLSSSALTTIGVSPIDSLVVYAGSQAGGVWITTDGGEMWADVKAGLPLRWVTRLTPDPFTASRCYVTLSGYVAQGSSQPHVFRTDDYGANWTNISGNMPEAPVNDIIVDPHDGNILYAATDVGVFVSETQGDSWAPLGAGMPITPVVDLAISPRNRRLVAASYGRSMFAAVLPCPDATDSDGDGVGDLCDNCPDEYNQNQEDIDADRIGDVCDECVDPDRDGFGTPGYAASVCPPDNCPENYNPDQTDLNDNGIGDACEFENLPVYDTLSTGCIDLVVSSFGNAGRQGTKLRSMDYGALGDCAEKYLYDGSTVVARIVDSDTLADFQLIGTNTFKRPEAGLPLTPVTDMGDYQYFNTGEYVTADVSIGLRKEWYAPRSGDTCTYMIARLRVYSYDGRPHSGLTIGEIADWDIPTGTGSGNTGGTAADRQLVYQSGTGYGCQKNIERFGGIALLGVVSGDTCLDTGVRLFGGYTESNPVYVYPIGTFEAGQLYARMQRPGFAVDGTIEDQHSVITFGTDITLAPGDTMDIVTFYGTIRQGTSAKLRQMTDSARAWAEAHLFPGCRCCVGERGNVDASADGEVNLLDLVALVDHLFISLRPVPCPEETNVDESPDGQISLGDLTAMIDHLFMSLSALPACP